MRMFLSPHIANKGSLGVSALALNQGGRRMSRDTFFFLSLLPSPPPPVSANYSCEKKSYVFFLQLKNSEPDPNLTKMKMRLRPRLSFPNAFLKLAFLKSQDGSFTSTE